VQWEDQVVKNPLDGLVRDPHEQGHHHDKGKDVTCHLERLLTRGPDDLLDLTNRVPSKSNQLLPGLGHEKQSQSRNHQKQQRTKLGPEALLGQSVERHHGANSQRCCAEQFGLVRACADGFDFGVRGHDLLHALRRHSLTAFRQSRDKQRHRP